MRYAVVDLEGTCCEDGSFPKSETETIQIGAALLSGPTFNQYVRPVRHPTLTDFCKALTGIEQKTVDTAETFPVVARRFWEWLGSAAICSWGSYDKAQLLQDCDYHGIHFEFTHVDLAKIYKRATKRVNGHRRAARVLGVESIGNPHNGLNDALTIRGILKQMIHRNMIEAES